MIVDVIGFIEERGMRVVNEDVVRLDLASFGILSVKTEGKNSFVE